MTTESDRVKPRRHGNWSSEFALTVECCRRAYACGDPRPFRELAATFDWARFARIVRFHRVQGLTWEGLTSIGVEIPTETASLLSAEARHVAAANLRMAVEARKIRAAFDQAGLALLFVKGLTTGALAYPDPMLKMGWDIDLLIDPAQLKGAAAMLAERGYRCIIPPESVPLEVWHRREKESVWKDDRGIHVELHTRLADNKLLIAGIDVHSPRREVEIAPGIVLPTLAANELFAYLCVHGASSLWFRLKWITDLAAILQQCDDQEIARLYATSQTLRAGRAASSALLLADKLYGSLRDSLLRSELASDRVSRSLCQAALRQLAGRPEPREPTEAVGGTLAIHLCQFALLADLRFKAGELLRQARGEPS